MSPCQTSRYEMDQRLDLIIFKGVSDQRRCIREGRPNNYLYRTWDVVDTPFLIGLLYLSFSAVEVTQKLKCSGNY